ncbi:MAG: hypothetical protein A3B13_02075 [Candidatus Liptonbacteria bacterium RIFCSPLOWO2_01_FULL_45_15]|uniref:Uncharacterized protein n=1 Tax=Candidatus Liptonbacteria bacterium RIFCSPLOWO2_01_FULL_45_15 TaxID=1798649 RepID=A0A1G2CEX6_9BACT|nr:MAG: hypothetical protein UT33_C0003G0010 [Candidatus Peregrinibacteria bacterium GW2011_GWC2_39_14]OGY99952.1 MAG: hypothetical protein A3B13_02075 [Candidatus Liptonbacteria bacterium RIFCSPLOWO2_01_FULL_45_15]
MQLDFSAFVETIKKSSPVIAFGIGLFLISSLITISQGIKIIHEYYTNTLGYKTKLIKNIELLYAGVNIDYFKQNFGAPLFVNHNLKINRIEYIFINKYFYLQAITDEVDTVLAYSITTRESDFNPSIELGPYTNENKIVNIKLGITHFSDLKDLGNPGNIFSFVGAHDFFYGEEYYFGNPGKYQSFYFATNESGYFDTKDEFGLPVEEKDIQIDNPRVQKFRGSQIINTYMITAPLTDAKDLFLNGFSNVNFFGGFYIGPNSSQVRVIP